MWGNHKKSWARSFLVSLCALGILAQPLNAHATSKGKIFVLTSTYGVMTGALAGLASLAFVNHPGRHGKNVAIGTSLGLYAGIILGAYIVYLTPDPKKERDKKDRQKKEPKAADDNDPGLDNPLNLDPQRSEIEIPRVVPLIYADSKGHPQLGVSFAF